MLLLAGCSTSTVASRKLERPAAYAALTPEQKQYVDAGQIRVGMSPDAVFLAWGAPDQIVQGESEGGLTTHWVYMGQWMEETRYWTYREVSRGKDGDPVMERYLDRDYFPRSYVSAEIIFENNLLKSWHTLPQPGY